MGRYFLVKTVDFSRNAIIDYSKLYLTFEALEDGTFSFSNDINYSIDNGETWVTLTANTQSPTITTGNTILWKKVLLSSSISGTFSSTGNFSVYGNIMSLLYGDNFEGKNQITDLCFESLFRESQVVNAHNLILPATTLEISCYDYMFYDCTSLVTAPELPATTLADYCYRYMFYGCTSLVTTPKLPATILTDSCYYGMFRGCTSLTTAPKLPSGQLADGCYEYMFQKCTSLTAAPELPATTLVQGCYAYMFYGCTKLNYIKMLATDISADGCLSYWVYHVSSTGTFVKNANATWGVTGSSGVPSKWTIITE